MTPSIPKSKDFIYVKALGNAIFSLLAICLILLSYASYHLKEIKGGDRIASLLSVGMALILALIFLAFIRSKELRRRFDALLRYASDMKESERKYKELTERMLEGYAYHKILLNDRNEPIDYLFLEANEAFEKLTGLKREEIIGRKATEAIPNINESDFDWISVYGEVAQSGRTHLFQSYFEPFQRWYSISAYSSTPGYFFTIFEDITESKTAIEALEASESALMALFSSIEDMIHVVDSEGRFLGIQTASAESVFPSNDSSIAKTLYDAYEFEKAKYFHQLIKEALEKRETLHSEYSLDADGEERWYYASISPMSESSVVWVTRDITPLKRSEKNLEESNQKLQETLIELQRTQSQIVQQERLRALGQMASGIAHDFNNSLVPMLGLSEMLLSDPKSLSDTEKVQRYLQLINIAAKDASNTVRRMRELYRTRSESEPLTSIDLNLLIRQTISLTEPKWKNQAQGDGITYEVRTDLRPLPFLLGNEAEIREVLTNLILNAIDAMPDGGSIFIYSSSNGESIDLSIKDTGIGMSPFVCKRCLDPFFTTKGEAGTGLGLAIAAGIIQRHEGDIKIESEENKGSTFRIRFPMREQTVTTREPDIEIKPVSSLSVLVVDDEPLVREVIEEFLNDVGYKVTCAEDGVSGLNRYQDGRFDIVVMDRAMPKMSGDQLAMEIKKLNPSQPVILLTGFGEMIKASGEPLEGIDLVLNKPVSPFDLIKAIDKILKASKN